MCGIDVKGFVNLERRKRLVWFRGFGVGFLEEVGIR